MREDIVMAAQEEFKAGVLELVATVVNNACDKQALETQGGINIQQAIDDQKAADNAILAEKLEEAHAAAQAQYDALQVKLDETTAKLNIDETVVNGLKDSMDKIQASLDALKSLFPAAPPVEG